MSCSYSSISLYEECSFKYKCRKIDKLSEEKSDALVNGIEKHQLCEEYLKGDRKRIPKGVSNIGGALRRLKKFEAIPEEWWHLTSNWESTDSWSWLVGKVDAYCFPRDSVIEITDFKTGKKYPNHRDQLSLYATMGLSIYDVKRVVARADYIDTGSSISYSWEVDDLSQLQDGWTKRIEAVITAEEFEPNPGWYCQWCSFSRLKGGPCKRG